MDFLFGTPERTEQVPRYNQSQQDVFSKMLSGGGGQLPQIFQFLQQLLSQDPEMMNQFQAPAKRSFEENTIPSIAERFTGMGGQNTSAFAQELGAAGAGLEENLSAQRAGLGSQAIQQLMQILGGGLTQQTDTISRPGQTGFLQGMAPGIGQGLGALAGGGAMGAGMSGLQSLFSLFNKNKNPNTNKVG